MSCVLCCRGFEGLPENGQNGQNGEDHNEPPHFIDAQGRDHGPLPPMGAHKTDVVLYSQYRRSRLDEIRNAVGLPGEGAP